MVPTTFGSAFAESRSFAGARPAAWSHRRSKMKPSGVEKRHNKAIRRDRVKRSAAKLCSKVKKRRAASDRKRLSVLFVFSRLAAKVSVGLSGSSRKLNLVDDRTVKYQGERYSLSGLATKLTGGKWGVAGSRYFKYNGIRLNELRARKEERQISPRLDDVWIIPCNPCYYDVVSAFEHLDVIEWNQTNNMTVGDTVYIYVTGEYKAILYKCEVVATNLHGNRSTEDDPYHLDMKKDPNARYMKLKRIEKYPADRYPLKDLLANGLTNVRGRSKATMQLMKYLGQ